MSAPHPNAFAAAFYGRNADAASNVATPVPKFELYKTLREEELHAYRAILRVFCMHSGVSAAPSAAQTPSQPPQPPQQQQQQTLSSDGSFSKAQLRMLEDLREAFCISNARHDVELLSAASDPLIGAVHSSGVAHRREPFFDGVTDVPVAPVATPAADDGFGVMIPRQIGGGGAAPGRPAGSAGGNTSAKKAPAATSGHSNHGAGASAAAPSSKYLQEITRIGEEARALGDRYIRAEAIDDRVALKAALLEKQKLLEGLRAQMIAERGDGASAVRQGAHPAGVKGGASP